MHIIPRLTNDGLLSLDAYSFSDRELRAVETTLGNAHARFDIENLGRDEAGRQGRRYNVAATSVPLLADFLNVRFVMRADVTVADIGPGGDDYKCEQIALGGPGTGCVNLSAQDEDAALVKCALIAHSKGWFGGAPSPGTCGGARQERSGLFGFLGQ
jgi:hypothetical protein